MSEKRFNERLTTATLEQCINAEDTVLRSLDYEGNETVKGNFTAGGDIVATDAQGNEISMRQLAEGGGGSDTPQFIQIKMTAASYTPGGDVIHISASGVSDLLSVDVSSYYSKLNGYSFHSMSIVDYVPSAYDDPEPPDIRPILSQACYDPSEREVRAWVFKAGETDLALYLKSIDVSILFVKDSE